VNVTRLMGSECFDAIDVHQPTKGVSYQCVIYFPPHPTNASALPGETRTPKIACFRLKVVYTPTNTKTTSIYHLVTAETRSVVSKIFH